jgi:hypothetical protein
MLRYPGQRGQRLGLKSFGVGVLHRSAFANRAVSRLSINSLATPITNTIAPITHGKGERRIRPRHTPSQICARLAGNLTVEAYTRHPWLPEFSKTRACCDIQVTVGKDSQSEIFIAAHFPNLAARGGSN